MLSSRQAKLPASFFTKPGGPKQDSSCFLWRVAELVSESIRFQSLHSVHRNS